MFTASLNLEALQQASQGSGRNCAAEGCREPVSQKSEYCSRHSKERAAKPPRRAKKPQD